MKQTSPFLYSMALLFELKIIFCYFIVAMPSTSSACCLILNLRNDKSCRTELLFVKTSLISIFN